MKTNLRYIFILLLAAVTLTAAAQDDFFPRNPNLDNAENYIADPAGKVSPDDCARLNAQIEQLRRLTTVELAIAVVPGIGDYEIQPYSVELFEKWGLGGSDKDNGLLIVIDTGKMQGFITTGYGLEGVLPDFEVEKIFRNDLAPDVKKGDIGAGLFACVQALSVKLSTPEAIEEIKSGNARNRTGRDLDDDDSLDAGTLWNFIFWEALAVFVVTLGFFCYDLWSCRRRDNYEKAMMWRSHLSMYWLAALFSVGMALPFALLALFLYRSGRNKRRRCATCGARMNKLSETDDNAYLSLSQDFEENLGTVDYDVWLCPKCGTVERFPFLEKQQKYSECPRCHTRAYALKCDRIIVPATTRAAGHGVRTYECLFCHHHDDKPYKIPRKDDGAAAAVAAGAILGSMGRGGGGGFGGGGFGGGSTGGGGAGGSF